MPVQPFGSRCPTLGDDDSLGAWEPVCECSPEILHHVVLDLHDVADQGTYMVLLCPHVIFYLDILRVAGEG